MIFKKGDKVVLVELSKGTTVYSPGDSNPYWPKFKDEDGLPIVGTVDGSNPSGWMNVNWSNGRENVYSYGTAKSELISFQDWQTLHGDKKKKAVPASIDLKELERVVMTDDRRDAIIAVLKQHKHSKKIFEDWGLGEVMEYGRGMTMLFHGPPGTGKTWTAICLAKSIGKKLLIMDNAKLQSSSPGEMERNIQDAFKEAKAKDMILLFDECDSLLMGRQNVGMILGSEINCLLTEIEKFDGMCILTTNRIGELDEALERRLSLILDFPAPDKEQLEAIWRKFLPKKLPLKKDVSVEEMSNWELTGGLVKNVVLNAVRFAVSEDLEQVSMEHFRKAARLIARGQVAFETPSETPSVQGITRAIREARELKRST